MGEGFFFLRGCGCILCFVDSGKSTFDKIFPFM